MLNITLVDLTRRGKVTHQAPAAVLRDHFGNPLVVIVEHQPGVTTTVVCEKGKEAEFGQELRRLGLHDMVPEMTRVTAQTLPSNYQPLKELM